MFFFLKFLYGGKASKYSLSRTNLHAIKYIHWWSVILFVNGCFEYQLCLNLRGLRHDLNQNFIFHSSDMHKMVYVRILNG